MALKAPSSPGRPQLADIQSFIRKYIPFSSRFSSATKSGMGQDVMFVFANANAPTDFTISLGQIPSRYIQQGATVGGILFASATDQTHWLPNNIRLQATVAGTYRGWVG